MVVNCLPAERSAAFAAAAGSRTCGPTGATYSVVTEQKWVEIYNELGTIAPLGEAPMLDPSPLTPDHELSAAERG